MSSRFGERLTQGNFDESYRPRVAEVEVSARTDTDFDTLRASPDETLAPERMKKNQRDDADERVEDAPLVAEPESFGTWLRRQREVREIDLREIADSSKVSMSYLQAFEEDRFDVLPSPVFAKGFLRQYARYVGLDPEEVVNFYLAARHPEGEEEPELHARTVQEPPSRNYVLLVLAVIACLVLVVWLLSVYSKRSSAGAVSEAAQSASPPAASAGHSTPAELAAAGGPGAQDGPGVQGHSLTSGNEPRTSAAGVAGAGTVPAATSGAPEGRASGRTARLLVAR